MILAVNGCPRNNGVSYTEHTLKQVLENGGMPSIPTLVWDDVAREGSAKSCHELIKLCAREYPGQDVLLLEDDVVCSKNALRACEVFAAPPGCEIVSFYNNRTRLTAAYGPVDIEYRDSAFPCNTSMMGVIPGMYLEDISDQFSYAQALRLSANLVDFIASRQWPKHVYMHPDEAKAVSPYQIRDRCLGHLASLISPYIVYVVPNWFQHIGDTSAVLSEGWDPTNRLKQVTSGNFITTEHDALTDDVSCLYHGLPRSQ